MLPRIERARQALGALALCLVALAALGAGAAGASDKPQEAAPQPPARVETRHTIALAGHPLDYRAVAEMIGLTDQKGEPSAAIFTVSYLAETPAGGKRPVAFVFNGG